MKVLTLRTAKALPDDYKGAPEFFVRIGGEVTRCTNLQAAQAATAYCPQSAAVTLMTPAAAAKYANKVAGRA